MISGIAGILAPNAQGIVERMVRAIAHRGTQVQVFRGDDRTTIGSVLLPLPVESYAAPAVAVRGNQLAVLEGEIYNATELWQRLGRDPAQAGGHSQLALELYQAYGPAFLRKLNGAFAVVVLDGGNALVARDALGRSPLYYGYADGILCFASELKAVREAASEYQVLPPGCYLEASGELYEVGAPSVTSSLPDEFEKLLGQLNAALINAVMLRVRGLQEVAVWLSGGVDSSVVASVACYACERVHSFAAGVPGAPDLSAARRAAEYLRTDHHEIHVDARDVERVLAHVVYHLESFDAPLVRSAVANFYAAQAGAAVAPIVLSGEGADELFGGYTYFKELPTEELPEALATSQRALHNTAFQRVDRMAASASARARVPFSDPELVAFANAIPPELKVAGKARTEKWVLRSAVSDLLPHELAWRPKDKFWSGSGVGSLLAEVAESHVSERRFRAAEAVRRRAAIRSREELHYYHLFRERFPEPAAVRCLGRTPQVSPQ